MIDRGKDVRFPGIPNWASRFDGMKLIYKHP
jgi:hypothetical protein